MTKLHTISLATTARVRDACLCLHVQRAARVLARHFDEAMHPLDLTNGQFSMLMALNREVPTSVGPLASFLAMDRTTLTAAIKPLERRGLVRTKVDPQDRRVRLLMLTAKGRSLLSRAVPIWRRTHAVVESFLPDVERDRLRHNLRALS